LSCISIYLKVNYLYNQLTPPRSQGDKWNLTFKISQNTYNLRALHYIKKELGAGSISVESKRNLAHFRIRDRKVINSIIFPIFDKYPLLTTKYFNYNIFKEAYFILENNNLTKLERNELLENLLLTKPSNSYISPAWGNITIPLKDANEAKKVVSKAWLTGFVEAECSFIIKKNINEYMVIFNITLNSTERSNLFVLYSIKQIFNISSSVKYDQCNGIYELTISNSRDCDSIIKFLNKKLKSIKSLEFKLWSKGYFYQKENNTNKIDKIYKILNRLIINYMINN